MAEETKKTGVSRYEGRDGRVTFPAIGALIGYFAHWVLTLDNRSRTYTLNATFGHVTPKLWSRTDYDRLVTVEIGKGNRYRLEQAEGAKTELVGKQLTMEGITLWPHQGR